MLYFLSLHGGKTIDRDLKKKNEYVIHGSMGAERQTREREREIEKRERERE